MNDHQLARALAEAHDAVGACGYRDGLIDEAELADAKARYASLRQQAEARGLVPAPAALPAMSRAERQAMHRARTDAMYPQRIVANSLGEARAAIENFFTRK